MTNSLGIHHITAITSDPQKNLDFYEGFLGQRLVKKTVNFDDPNAYHLYYGDYAGTPGTILTFFYWEEIPKGERGVGEVSALAYRIAPDSKQFWIERAMEFQIDIEPGHNDFGEEMLVLRDPDGIVIELVLSKGERVKDWSQGPVPPEHQLQGFYNATLFVRRTESIERVLTDGLGFSRVREEHEAVRFESTTEPGRYITVKADADAPPARQGAGSVHHIAFQADTDTEREELRAQVMKLGVDATGLVDRQYFHSTYFMTPAYILFEIATDDIGFTVDESLEELGRNLRVPPQYEEHRYTIEANLQPLTLPRDS